MGKLLIDELKSFLAAMTENHQMLQDQHGRGVVWTMGDLNIQGIVNTKTMMKHMCRDYAHQVVEPAIERAQTKQHQDISTTMAVDLHMSHKACDATDIQDLVDLAIKAPTTRAGHRMMPTAWGGQ